ncbi:MAG: hypothetical protein ABDI20_09655, partial [Candidatus Bipolaricaulaceae bacterium]
GAGREAPEVRELVVAAAREATGRALRQALDRGGRRTPLSRAKELGSALSLVTSPRPLVGQ